LDDLTSYELGTITLRKSLVNVNGIWANVLEILEPLALAKEQTILQFIEPDCILSADPNSLYQMFENLLSNAIKYSPKGAQIHIVLKKTISSARRECVNFAIRDEGPGFSDNDKQKMFGMFQKLSATPTAGESSHGVGLAIVKQTVEAHGGMIIVESTLGTGATFCVELPKNVE
jgi:signal transduction histidine kinase